MRILCRDCLSFEPAAGPSDRCHACQSPRVAVHVELDQLAVAHIDCDAFYANVEKRDRPELLDRPVIVGGGRRGVVMAACYVARLYGVRSAMPMFKALKACPDATVIHPDMAKYQRIGRRIRRMMADLTPLVEPLSIDEAFLDLTGTEALHDGPPARTLAAFALRVEQQCGLSVSIGLSHNKFLAKVASDLDKPRGFAVIGRAEAQAFLEDKSIGIIWGAGRALQKALARDGITTMGDLRAHEEVDLVLRYGAIGRRLYKFSRGEDDRRVEPDAAAKSISAETTFDEDQADTAELAERLWPLCEKVSERLKRAHLAGWTVTLKLKTADFRIVTRSQRLSDPTPMAEILYRTASNLLERECDGRRFRLIGVGASDLAQADPGDPPRLLDGTLQHQIDVETVIDDVRAKLGANAISKGRAFSKHKSDSGGT